MVQRRVLQPELFMLNLEVGSPRNVDGRACIVTQKGRVGHAVYGPYRMLEPGDYLAEFVLSRAEDELFEQDFRCAALDIVRGAEHDMLAFKPIFFSQLAQGRSSFSMPFTLDAPGRMEFRIWVSGHVSLLIEDAPRVVHVSEGDDPLAPGEGGAFPGAEGDAIPFFVEYRAWFRQLYDQGHGVAIRRGQIVLTVHGVSFHARTPDDLTFVGEVFFESVYNFKCRDDVCVIDIGMNAGLASLMFASKREVREVHAFEPFRNTYDRAADNLALNPRIAGKIEAHNIGMSDHDVAESITVPIAGDSGSASTLRVENGIPVHVTLKDAGAFLRPIILKAQAKGLRVIVKVDCEGSEFAVFRSLEQHGLLDRIDAFMVEWHAIFADKTQETLIAPLRKHGFLVFDRSAPVGNGFFYATRFA